MKVVKTLKNEKVCKKVKNVKNVKKKSMYNWKKNVNKWGRT